MSCPDCFRGGVSTSHPTGEETTIHGIPTYIATPGEGITPKGIVVIITDAFGWKFVNNRVLADHYAKRGGFLVYCPDFMNGNAMHHDVLTHMDNIMKPSPWTTTVFYKPLYVFQTLSAFIPWKIKTRIAITQAPVFAFFQALRTSPPPFPTTDLKIAAAGFCWGGKHTILLAQDIPSSRVQRHESQASAKWPEKLIDCAFTAHPSFIDVPGDIEAIAVPTSVVVGDVDIQMKEPAVIQMAKILGGKEGDHEVVVLKGAKHGFAVRTHPDDGYEMECAEKAEKQAVEWIGRLFS